MSTKGVTHNTRSGCRPVLLSEWQEACMNCERYGTIQDQMITDVHENFFCSAACGWSYVLRALERQEAVQLGKNNKAAKVNSTVYKDYAKYVNDNNRAARGVYTEQKSALKAESKIRVFDKSRVKDLGVESTVPNLKCSGTRPPKPPKSSGKRAGSKSDSRPL